MKNFLKLIYIIYFFLINRINSSGSEEIKPIIPDEKLILKEVKLNKEILLNININQFEKLQKYKIMVHYIGSYAISFKISLVCDDIYLIKNQQKGGDVQMNDFSEFDFQTNENRIPAQCGDTYDKKKVLLSLTPYSIAYQFIPEKDIKFNIIVELITNKFNTDVKPLNIMFNKDLYKGIIFGVILIILIFTVFKKKIRSDLVDILLNNNEIKKHK